MNHRFLLRSHSWLNRLSCGFLVALAVHLLPNVFLIFRALAEGRIDNLVHAAGTVVLAEWYCVIGYMFFYSTWLTALSVAVLVLVFYCFIARWVMHNDRKGLVVTCICGLYFDLCFLLA